MSEVERKQQLLMGLIDGELNDKERIEITDTLRRDAQLREEYDQLLQASGILENMNSFELSEHEIRKLWRNPYRKWVIGLAYLLMGIAFIVIGGIVAFSYLISVSEHVVSGEIFTTAFIVKAVIGSFVIGLMLLFYMALRDRLKIVKNDPYKDVEI